MHPVYKYHVPRAALYAAVAVAELLLRPLLEIITTMVMVMIIDDDDDNNAGRIGCRGRNAQTQRPSTVDLPDEHRRHETTYVYTTATVRTGNDSNNIINIVQASNQDLRENSKGQSPPVWHFQGAAFVDESFKKTCAYKFFLKS